MWNLLGRAERVTAPTAPLPTVMESAGGRPQEAWRPRPGRLALRRLRGALRHAANKMALVLNRNGAPLQHWVSRARFKRTVTPPK